MGIVVDEFEVLVLEIEEALHIGIEFHLRQGTGLTRQLKLRLLDMVQIEVGVARRVDKVASLIACDLRHHLQQEGVGGDVEGHAQERIC